MIISSCDLESIQLALFLVSSTITLAATWGIGIEYVFRTRRLRHKNQFFTNGSGSQKKLNDSKRLKVTQYFDYTTILSVIFCCFCTAFVWVYMIWMIAFPCEDFNNYYILGRYGIFRIIATTLNYFIKIATFLIYHGRLYYAFQGTSDPYCGSHRLFVSYNVCMVILMFIGVFFGYLGTYLRSPIMEWLGFHPFRFLYIICLIILWHEFNKRMIKVMSDMAKLGCREMSAFNVKNIKRIGTDANKFDAESIMSSNTAKLSITGFDDNNFATTFKKHKTLENDTKQQQKMQSDNVEYNNGQNKKANEIDDNIDSKHLRMQQTQTATKWNASNANDRDSKQWEEIDANIAQMAELGLKLEVAASEGSAIATVSNSELRFDVSANEKRESILQVTANNATDENRSENKLEIIATTELGPNTKHISNKTKTKQKASKKPTKRKYCGGVTLNKTAILKLVNLLEIIVRGSTLLTFDIISMLGVSLAWTLHLYAFEGSHISMCGAMLAMSIDALVNIICVLLPFAQSQHAYDILCKCETDGVPIKCCNYVWKKIRCDCKCKRYKQESTTRIENGTDRAGTDAVEKNGDTKSLEKDAKDVNSEEVELMVRNIFERHGKWGCHWCCLGLFDTIIACSK